MQNSMAEVKQKNNLKDKQWNNMQKNKENNKLKYWVIKKKHRFSRILRQNRNRRSRRKTKEDQMEENAEKQGNEQCQEGREQVQIKQRVK